VDHVAQDKQRFMRREYEGLPSLYLIIYLYTYSRDPVVDLSNGNDGLIRANDYVTKNHVHFLYNSQSHAAIFQRCNAINNSPESQLNLLKWIK